MSQSPTFPAAARNGTADDVRTITAQDTVQAVLEALDDPGCRAVLEATSDDSLSANEISETCDLPLSTAYRKLDLLTEVDLLDERTRVSSDGKHASEYTRAVEKVAVSMGANGVELEVTRRELGSSTGPRASIAGD